MKSRVNELYYEYCVPKPKYFVRIYDTQVEDYPEVNEAESESIDVYINVVM